MTTSGTKTFTLDVAQIVEEALERVGGNPISGDEAASARRSLNLLLTYLVTENAPLNTQKQTSLSTVVSTATYNLDTEVLNIRNAVVLDSNGQEYELNREDIQEYNTSYMKSQTGRPTTYFVDRTRDRLILTLWPKPDKIYTIRLWNTVRLEDVSTASENIDIPVTYLPAICSGLSYYVSLKRRGIDAAYRAELKQLFTTELNAALKEDRLRTDMTIVPGR